MRLRVNSAVMAWPLPCCAALLLAVADSGALGAQAGPKRTYLELPSLQERWMNQLPRPDKEQYTRIQVIIPSDVFPPAVLEMDDDQAHLSSRQVGHSSSVGSFQLSAVVGLLHDTLPL